MLKKGDFYFFLFIFSLIRGFVDQWNFVLISASDYTLHQEDDNTNTKIRRKELLDNDLDKDIDKDEFCEKFRSLLNIHLQAIFIDFPNESNDIVEQIQRIDKYIENFSVVPLSKENRRSTMVEKSTTISMEPKSIKQHSKKHSFKCAKKIVICREKTILFFLIENINPDDSLENLEKSFNEKLNQFLHTIRQHISSYKKKLENLLIKSITKQIEDEYCKENKYQEGTLHQLGKCPIGFVLNQEYFSEKQENKLLLKIPLNVEEIRSTITKIGEEIKTINNIKINQNDKLERKNNNASIEEHQEEDDSDEEYEHNSYLISPDTQHEKHYELGTQTNKICTGTNLFKDSLIKYNNPNEESNIFLVETTFTIEDMKRSRHPSKKNKYLTFKIVTAIFLTVALLAGGYFGFKYFIKSKKSIEDQDLIDTNDTDIVISK